MEQGFDDKELSDIMKEIEALEVEYSADSEEKSESKSVMEELVDISEHEAVLPTNRTEASVLSFDQFDKAPPAKTFEPQETPVYTHSQTQAISKTHSSMTFKVQGDLQMDLQFEIGGKIVMLEVSETGLKIQMEGGVTFNVPVSDAHSLKKAV